LGFDRVGYVEFKSEETVPLALQLTGQKLLGIPIIAQLTEAEKNRQTRPPPAAERNPLDNANNRNAPADIPILGHPIPRLGQTVGGGPAQNQRQGWVPGMPFHRLYVGNIHFNITETDLQSIFEPFGELEFVQLQKEESGRSKGYGFVQ